MPLCHAEVKLSKFPKKKMQCRACVCVCLCVYQTTPQRERKILNFEIMGLILHEQYEMTTPVLFSALLIHLNLREN
jgi:hypothetical protein